MLGTDTHSATAIAFQGVERRQMYRVSFLSYQRILFCETAFDKQALFRIIGE